MVSCRFSKNEQYLKRPNDQTHVMSWYANTVSLPSATGTRIDSGCKHIVTCRVDTSMLQMLVKDPRDLASNPNKYNLKQGDIVLSTYSTWCDTDTEKREDAYPLVISNLGELDPVAQNIMRFVYHNVSSLYERDEMLKAFRNERSRIKFDQGNYFDVNADGSLKTHYKQYLSKIVDCLGMGGALTEAQAVGTRGDTAASVMVGGMITVTNGAFEIKGGDEVQVYWEFEQNCFDEKTGRRRPMTTARLQNPADVNSDVFFENVNISSNNPWNDESMARRNFALRGTDVGPGKNKRIIALVKSYKEDEGQPRLYDKLRVIGRANHDAQPGQMIDIKLGRQSL